MYLLLFVPAGVAAEQAISLSLALYVIRVCTGVIGGLLYMLRTILNITRFPRKDLA